MTGEDILTKFEITEGKIQSAVEGLRDDCLLYTSNNYRITFEQENTFVAHDLMRCAVFTGAEILGTGWKCRKATRKG